MPTEFERDWSYQGKTLAQRMFSDTVVKHCITAFIILTMVVLCSKYPAQIIQLFMSIN